tara:strand:+ start:716 stop:3112 length:2397 start_codon:yes stop_codon:yes gene_type:complete
MNILGKPFQEFVTDQIFTRQGSLKKGKFRNSTEDLLYQQTKTPWLRMASAVDIKDSKFKESLIGLGFSSSDISGQALAKNFMLQGGAVAKTSNSFTPNQGINFGTNFKGAYGWGGTTERGAIPMPGLTGASVKYINNGALTKTEVKGKCFSRNQLALIDALYMRPGYTVLLEFGWSVYLDNASNLQTFDNFNSPALRHLFSSSKNHYKLLKKIKDEQRTRNGNYEGVYGKISNFNWKFNSDGSYDWSITLVGVGEIIESLKINTINLGEVEGTVEDQGDSDELPIVAQATRTSLNEWLYSIYQNNGTGDPDHEFRWGYIRDFTHINSDGSTLTDPLLQIDNAEFHCDIDSVDDDEWNTGPQIYITFGYLMAWIQKNILLKNPSNGIPVCCFDMNFPDLNNDKNFFRYPKGNFSSQLLNVITPFEQPPSTFDEFPEPAKMFRVINRTLMPSFKYDNQNARLSQVLLNINGLAQLLEECPEDEDNAKSLLDFLKKVIGAINTSTGGINDIVIELNDDQSRIVFRNKSPQSFDSPPSELGGMLCTINTFGTDTIVRQLSIDGSISSNFSTMVTIGAQANGNQTAGDATTFSSYNAGLVDRIMPIKANQGSEDGEGDEEIESPVDKVNRMIKIMTTAGGFWDAVSGGAGGVWEDVMDDLEWLSEDLTTFNSQHTQYIQSLMAYNSQPKQEGGTGKSVAFFLPFNLNIDIDGISGIRLFERFKIDDRVLPLSYESGRVDILVKSVDHDVSLNGWTTKIGTISAPASSTKKDFQYVKRQKNYFDGSEIPEDVFDGRGPLRLENF